MWVIKQQVNDYHCAVCLPGWKKVDDIKIIRHEKKITKKRIKLKPTQHQRKSPQKMKRQTTILK